MERENQPGMADALAEQQFEEAHLEDTKEKIRSNIAKLEDEVGHVRKAFEELNDELTPRDRELNTQKAIQLSLTNAQLTFAEEMLLKNEAGLNIPYFGRIDYQEEDTKNKESYYIGKHGLPYGDDVLVVDWRAPIAKLYYENQLGEGSYEVPAGPPVEVNLNLKRTFDIEGGKLLGFYDSDVAANDELLVKYLAQHKEVALGDIIATIQQEQDQIIRATPFQNSIVQGVAGSGKTTVALHRISHILYNWPDRYKDKDFLIIGGSELLLDYIASGLPDLDVRNVTKCRMDVFLQEELGEDFQSAYELASPSETETFKCRFGFISEVDRYFKRVWLRELKPRTIEDDELGEILSRDQMYEMLNYRQDYSLRRAETLLNETLQMRIRMMTDSVKKDPDHQAKLALRRKKLAQYDRYFRSAQDHSNVLEMYRVFLQDYVSRHPEAAATRTSRDERNLTVGRLSVYDLAAMNLIRKYMTEEEETIPYGQIVIDEAQDFGESVYYVLRRLQPKAYFTIMGDVSQNIRYETGMNDWTAVTEQIFNATTDRFYKLKKSYRNTIEISNFASKILARTVDPAVGKTEDFEIEPVIRHGEEVYVQGLAADDKKPAVLDMIATARANEYHSMAIITRHREEAERLTEKLLDEGMVGTLSLADAMKAGGAFQLMVLPVEDCKGLEFDSVLLYDVTRENYPNEPREAKKLYVAVTRALHELNVIYPEEGEVSELIAD